MQAYLNDLMKKTYRHQLIHVITDATITDVSGYVGNFVTKVKSKGRVQEIKHGAAIIATGADEYKPTEYLYGQDDRVHDPARAGGADRRRRRAGAQRAERGDDPVRRLPAGRPQLLLARLLQRRDEERAEAQGASTRTMDIYVLFRDMRTYGFNEDYYREASSKDVKFIRYEPEDKPMVEAVDEGGRKVLQVTATDPILGKRLALDADAIVLAAAVVPSAGSEDTARLFKVPLSPDGFFQEAHVKLRPVDFAAEGVYLCGTAQYPKHLSEAISQAYGAAGRALTLLTHDTVVASGSVCEVDEARLRLLRRLHHRLHLRRDRVPRHAARQEGRDQPGAVQGRRPVQREVPDRRHLPEALHRRRGVRPDRRRAGGLEKEKRPWPPHPNSSRPSSGSCATGAATAAPTWPASRASSTRPTCA